MGCTLLDTKARLMSVSGGEKGAQLLGRGEGDGYTEVRGSAELTKHSEQIRKEV